jgi:flagellar biosynthesis chaperone FliJ
MIAAVTDSGLQSHSCFIHTLHLSITDSIFAQQAIMTIVNINRDTVKHFNQSASAVNKLMEIQEQLHLKKHKLIQDISTHWNSTYCMLGKSTEQ